jgi:hypothetical protein
VRSIFCHVYITQYEFSEKIKNFWALCKKNHNVGLIWIKMKLATYLMVWILGVKCNRNLLTGMIALHTPVSQNWLTLRSCIKEKPCSMIRGTEDVYIRGIHICPFSTHFHYKLSVYISKKTLTAWVGVYDRWELALIKDNGVTYLVCSPYCAANVFSRP